MSSRAAATGSSSVSVDAVRGGKAFATVARKAHLKSVPMNELNVLRLKNHSVSMCDECGRRSRSDHAKEARGARNERKFPVFSGHKCGVTVTGLVCTLFVAEVTTLRTICVKTRRVSERWSSPVP